ncbi:FAD binding domain-containing protein [Phyllosticta citriasiana]|uniref:FAD binding domain-containing protein n=1 Tax=Phyllosticta citriasiana TaxID=595635 RepID=A0ABR1KXW5_9PEZI
MTVTETPESTCDVLIIGAGPAGLMTAAWMARSGIKTRIVDKRGTKIFTGQADGLQCRSLEIFDSFGFADRAWKEANHMLEICMWNPGADGQIRRSDRVPDTPPSISRFTECVLQQGRIERFFLDHMKEHSDIEVERGVLPMSLDVDEAQVEDEDAYPITVKLRHLTDEEAMPKQVKLTSEGVTNGDGLYRSNLSPDDTDDLIRKNREMGGTEEVLKAKYVVGCDGAHSWTRRQLGFEMQGEATDFIWGVLDIIPITDFPDIRQRCIIHSADQGTLMVIPRERGLVRLYIQLKEIVPDAASGRADRSKITPDIIFKAAQKILSPYQLRYNYCDWWTAYQIGQRVSPSFSLHNRIFLAGDAVHTHSPKAGQGMNVSMADGYNLGWKLALTVQKLSATRTSLLSTYSPERRAIANQLIAFDHQFSRLFTGRPARDIADKEGVSMADLRAAFDQNALFTSGLSVTYEPSALISIPHDALPAAEAPPSTPHANHPPPKLIPPAPRSPLATRLPIGTRIPSYKVVNQASALPLHLHALLPSAGPSPPFRILLFAGNMVAPAQSERVRAFCRALESGLLRTFTPPNIALNTSTAPLQVLTIHSAPREDVELLQHFPAILHPFDEQRGWDYERVWCDAPSYHEGWDRAYEGLGIDGERGAVVVVRPDQVVAWVGDVEEAVAVEGGGGLRAFLRGVLRVW